MKDMQKLKGAIEYILSQESKQYLDSGDDFDVAHAVYDAEVTPTAVLELIAENEALSKLPTAWTEVYEQSAELDVLRDEQLAWLNERDNLRAENAGLKTGYEAYEQVNAELRGEVEKLRKDAERYRWLRESCVRDWDVRYENMEIFVKTPHHDCDGLDVCIDAAMSKGEQS